jgi:NADPH:quinone reductase-like Zn-dependent oxidoreductase
MKALRVIRCASGTTLVEDRMPKPTPGPEELLIRVRAAGVMPSELAWYPTTHSQSGEPRIGAVPGHEFSGVVEAIGKDVGNLEVGREVFGMNDWFAEGAMAEYCIAPFCAVAPKPQSVPHNEAASVPISALTAFQALRGRAGLRFGERVLILGGAGAVGAYAIQLARRMGAHVITTVSARGVEIARRLGAAEVLDHDKISVADRCRDIDVLIDTVGGPTLESVWRTLKPNGRAATIVSGPQSDRAKASFFLVEANQKQLCEIAYLIERGELETQVDSLVPFERAADAYLGRLQRRGHGKIVMQFPVLSPALEGNMQTEASSEPAC